MCLNTLTKFLCFITQLVVADGALVYASAIVIVGSSIGGNTNLLISVSNSSIIATNVSGTGILNVSKGGTLRMNGGNLKADVFYHIDAPANFTFNAGTFDVGNATVTNGKVFVVGNGVSNGLALIWWTGSA